MSLIPPVNKTPAACSFRCALLQLPASARAITERSRLVCARCRPIALLICLGVCVSSRDLHIALAFANCATCSTDFDECVCFLQVCAAHSFGSLCVPLWRTYDKQINMLLSLWFKCAPRVDNVMRIYYNRCLCMVCVIRKNTFKIFLYHRRIN